jgi:hypothetical protein
VSAPARRAGDPAPFATTAVDAAGIPLFAAAMLEPSEIIIGTWRPHPAWIAFRAARTCTFAALIGAIGAAAAGAAGLAWAPAIGQAVALVVAARAVVALAEWASRMYVLTDRRVLRRRGLLSPTVYSAPLGSLRRVELVRSWSDRPFRTGTITFSTVPNPGYEAAWLMLARPDDVLAEIDRARRRYGR